MAYVMVREFRNPPFGGQGVQAAAFGGGGSGVLAAVFWGGGPNSRLLGRCGGVEAVAFFGGGERSSSSRPFFGGGESKQPPLFRVDMKGPGAGFTSCVPIGSDPGAA